MQVISEFNVMIQHMFSNVYHGSSCYWCRLIKHKSVEHKTLFPYEGTLDSAEFQHRVFRNELKKSEEYTSDLKKVYGFELEGDSTFNFVVTEHASLQDTPAFVLNFGEPLKLAYEYFDKDGNQGIHEHFPATTHDTVVFNIHTKQPEVFLEFFMRLVLQKYISLDTLFQRTLEFLKHTQDSFSVFSSQLIDFEKSYFSLPFFKI